MKDIKQPVVIYARESNHAGANESLEKQKNMKMYQKLVQ